jgi:hypothetical protein
MNSRALIGHSNLHQRRTFGINAIVRFGLAIGLGGSICARHHSESTSSEPLREPTVGRGQAEISNAAGRRQQCVIEVRDTG